MLRYFPKSRESKILRPVYQEILDRIKTMTHSSTCTHIKVNGLRCGCPSLRGEQFCYFHQRMHRGVRMPAQARLHPIALIEDEESIQAALMEVINALMRNTIDLKRATLILRALHIAVKNATRVKFGLEKTNMVRDIPQYEEEPAATAASAVKATPSGATASVAGTRALALGYPTAADTTTELDLPAVAASEPKPVTPDSEFLKNWEAGGIELKRQAAARQAAAAAATTTPAPGLPNHDFKPQPPASAERQTTSTASNPAPKRDAPPNPPRKPAASAPAAPKERKNAAHAVRHG